MKPAQLLGSVMSPIAWPAVISTPNTTTYTDT